MLEGAEECVEAEEEGCDPGQMALPGKGGHRSEAVLFEYLPSSQVTLDSCGQHPVTETSFQTPSFSVEIGGLWQDGSTC